MLLLDGRGSFGTLMLEPPALHATLHLPYLGDSAGSNKNVYPVVTPGCGYGSSNSAAE